MDEPIKLWNKRTRNSVNLRIAFYGKYNCLQIGKDVLRVLGGPQYITIRVNKAMDSLLIEAVMEKHKLSFKVPDGIMISHNKKMILYSQSFVQEMMLKNELDINETYELSGIYSESNNAVIFNVADSTKHVSIL